MVDKAAAQSTASGLEALIARLKDEGVGEGRAEAERLIADAQTRAHRITEKAEAEAKHKVETAQREAEALRRAGEDALRIASRDTVLELKESLERRFANEIVAAVAAASRDDELLKRMILEVVGRARDEGGSERAKDVEVILPRHAVGLDELHAKPEALEPGTIAHFAAATAADMLRKGVAFTRAEDEAGGIRVKLGDRGVTLDLSDEAVAAALLAHLQPRFRAFLDGVLKQ